MRGPAVTVEMASWTDHSELCAELKKGEKLLNIGVGLMLWQKGGMKQCEWNEHQI